MTQAQLTTAWTNCVGGNAQRSAMAVYRSGSTCPAPTNGHPRDGETLNSRSVTFTWDPPSCSGLDYYTFRVADHADIDNQPWIIDHGVSAGAMSITENIPAEHERKTLYWAIWPHNSAGYGPKGGPWNFRIDTSPPPPPPPIEGVEILSIYPSGHNFHPNDQFTPRVRIRVSGFTLSEARGDHLHNRDGNTYGAWAVQAVRGENLTEYEFVMDAMTAPGNEGSCSSKWQLRVGGEYKGPEINLSFNVQNEPPPPPPPAGWHCEYFNDTHLGSRCSETWESSTYIFKDWEYGAPAGGCNSNDFSARFTRDVFFEGGTYSFQLQHDDGAKLFVDGQEVIGAWWPGDGGHGRDWNVSRGTHQVKVEYYDNNDHARVEAYWYGPGALPSNTCDPNQWCAQYRGNKRLWGPVAFLQNEGAYFLDKQFGMGGPGYGLPADDFCSRFERTLYFSRGRWRFHISTDDGARFWVDGNLKLDKWFDQVNSYTVDVDLEEGEHFLRVEHFESGGGAAISLRWENITPPDTEAPVVDWIAPVGNKGTYHVADEIVQLKVNATDNVAVDHVSFERWDHPTQETIPLGESSSPPYVISLDTRTLNYEWNQINAYAYDTSGNKSARQFIYLYRDRSTATCTQTPILTRTGTPTPTRTRTPTPTPTATAISDAEAPVVNWLAPAGNGETYHVADETIQLKVDANDNIAVDHVSFERWDHPTQETIPLGESSSLPYAINLDTRTLNYEWNQINAYAYDTSGNKSTRQFIWLYRDRSMPTCTQRPTSTQTNTPTRTPIYMSTATRTPPPSTSTPTPLSLIVWQEEAESGTLAPPMTRGVDAEASGGEYVFCPQNRYTPPGIGSVTFTFAVPEAGEYCLWTRVMGLGWNADSFFVSIDGDAESRDEIPQFGGQWTWGWQEVDGNPLILQAGEHTLCISGREAYARLDSLRLVSSSRFVCAIPWIGSTR